MLGLTLRMRLERDLGFGWRTQVGLSRLLKVWRWLHLSLALIGRAAVLTLVIGICSARLLRYNAVTPAVKVLSVFERGHLIWSPTVSHSLWTGLGSAGWCCLRKVAGSPLRSRAKARRLILSIACC